MYENDIFGLRIFFWTISYAFCIFLINRIGDINISKLNIFLLIQKIELLRHDDVIMMSLKNTILSHGRAIEETVRNWPN